MHTKIHIKLFCKSVDEERGKGIFELKFCDTNIYINNNEVSKNELASGLGRFVPHEYDCVLGDYIKLPEKKF